MVHGRVIYNKLRSAPMAMLPPCLRQEDARKGTRECVQIISLAIYLRKKGSKTKKKMKEEEIEKGDCGPPTCSSPTKSQQVTGINIAIMTRRWLRTKCRRTWRIFQKATKISHVACSQQPA